MNLIPEGKILVQFDGMCILCSRTIRFLLKTDRKNKFIFQALPNSSDDESPKTVIISDHFGQHYYYFDAVLKIGYELGGMYSLVAVFRLIPKKWRLSLYKWIAKNRFRWFGKRQSCYIPTEDEKGKFI
ncbi:MAG: DCC1-like thiol-disulfide oxidoreductase family protein [Bacteroidota bacterium]|nr:thiol-disulfide oxidoreductase [Odoribacter sp.]MDP3643600.1 DCC1-like thiol-disulfide oxidoreductase family protein [Bacteroidota bacterium]